MANKKSGDDSLDLGYLDELIKKYAEKLIQNVENEQIKIGDLLKMIELKRKLSPSDSEHNKLWKMLEKIRIDEANKTQNSIPEEKTK